jgi:hypothetical protein
VVDVTLEGPAQAQVATADRLVAHLAGCTTTSFPGGLLVSFEVTTAGLRAAVLEGTNYAEAVAGPPWSITAVTATQGEQAESPSPKGRASTGWR